MAAIDERLERASARRLHISESTEEKHIDKGLAQIARANLDQDLKSE